MASGARKVEYDIVSNDKSAPGLSSAERGLDKFNDKVKKSKADASKAGVDAGIGFVSAFGSAAASSARLAGGPVAAGMAAVIVPAIGASVAAAVVGGAGLTGIVGGVAAASRDSRVKAAAASLGETFLGAIDSKSGVFVEPILDALEQVEGRADDLERILGRAFGSAAKYIGPLTEDLLDAAEAIGEGFADAVGGAGPVIAQLGDSVEQVANAIGEGLSELSDNGDEAAIVIMDIGSALTILTDITFEAVEGLTVVYGWLRAYSELMTGDVATAAQIVTGLTTDQSGANDDLSSSYEILLENEKAAKEAAEALEEQYNELYDSIFKVANLNISAAEAQLNYNQTLKDTAEDIDWLADVTDKEDKALLSLAKSGNAVVESLVRQGASSDEVAAASSRARSDFIKTATQMGYTAKEAEGLANKFLTIPSQVRTLANFQDDAAKAEIERLKARLGDIPSLINVAIRVTQTGASPSAVAAGLRKQNAFNADDSFMGFEARTMAAAAFQVGSFAISGNSQVNRIGGPTPVSVSSDVNVNLNGKPFYDMTVSAVTDNNRRRKYWEKVGRR